MSQNPPRALIEVTFRHESGDVVYRREVIVQDRHATAIDQLLNHDWTGEPLPPEARPKGQ